MARQLSIRSGVKWFGRLSFEQQQDALSLIQEQHELSRAAKIAELEQQLLALGNGTRKVWSRPPAASKKPKSVKRKNGANGSVKAKYRDSKTGKTWSGRGRMASWLKSKQDAGEKTEKYLI